MKMKKRIIEKRIVVAVLTAVVLLTSIFPVNGIAVYAKDTIASISGKLYEFAEKSEYEYSSNTSTQTIANSGELGAFSISGDIKAIQDVNGFKAYQVQHTDVMERKGKEGIVKLSYVIGNKLKGAAETDWHIVEDKTSKVDGLKLDEKILSGAIILQTSLDGKNWITDMNRTNIAGDKSEYESNFYDTKGIQQVNGCYYRVIVVYKTEKRLEDTKVGPITQKQYGYKKYAEIYEFYLIDSLEKTSEATLPTATPRKELGKKINTGKDNGFSGNESITNKDAHFGWDIGTFYLNGYTREQAVAGSEDPVFLKTVGDRVTLWFNLNEDINALNGKDTLSINEDKNGYDQYFEVEKTNFKHGALIIRFKDFEGKVQKPVIYTDYLAASARTGANTKVELFEEGDYEVALDYEIKDTAELIDAYTNYRIFFKFKIRNGNCMVYPFDISTGAELSDNALTENGFKLDLAKSRYLEVNIVRDAVKKENDRYSLDTRENTATQDGKAYTTEGIYTFTVKNPSTGESTIKTIYVGSSPIYKTLASGKTIESINELLDQGGQLQDDGLILTPAQEDPKELINTETVADEKEESEPKTTDVIENISETAEANEKSAVPNILVFVVLGIAFVAVIIMVASKKKRKPLNIQDPSLIREDIQKEDES